MHARNTELLVRRITVAVGLASMGVVCPAVAQDLPFATVLPGQIFDQMQLRLELVLNGRVTGRVIPVQKRGDHLLVLASDLISVGINNNWYPEDLVDLTSEQDVASTYSQSDQSLHLTVPPDWLPKQQVRSASRGPRIEPDSDFGALINYDLFFTHSNGGTRSSVRTEVRLFGNFGTVGTTGNLDLGDLRTRRDDKRFIRYDTTWTYVDDDKIRTYEAGDFITRTLSWSNPVRLGGVQISRDFGVRPDVVTYPLPAFTGSAAVPSALDLYVNGYRTISTTLEPGPFTVGDLPYISGAGEAVMVMTDMQGRQVQTSIPFYVANTLLRPGLADYAISIGKLRRAYGTKSFSYGRTAASVSGRLGISDFLTIEATAEGAGGHASAGLGGLMRMGQRLGVLDASVSFSRQSGKKGRQYTLGYQYYGKHFNLVARSIFRNEDYGDLSTYNCFWQRLPTKQLQAQASAIMGKEYGTLSLGYIQTELEDETFKQASLSYFRPFRGNSSVNISINQDFVTESTGAFFRLVFPLGSQTTTVAAVERTAGGLWRTAGTASHGIPSNGGIGWAAGASHDSAGAERYQANVAWRNRAMQLAGGVYSERGATTSWGEANGSVVLMGNGAFLSNSINDAFALVDTDGVGKVPVRYENRLIGLTNKKGQLLIPWVPSYYPAKFEIDTLDLPPDAQAPVVEQRVAVTRGSGKLLRFPIRQTASARVELVDASGKTLPAGTRVNDQSGGETWVGLDGSAYLQGLRERNVVTATFANRSQCVARFDFHGETGGIGQIGPVECR